MDVKVNISKLLDLTYKAVLYHVEEKELFIPHKEELAMAVALDITSNLSDLTMSFKHAHCNVSSKSTQTDIDSSIELVFSTCESSTEIENVLSTLAATASTITTADLEHSDSQDTDHDSDIRILTPPIWTDEEQP